MLTIHKASAGSGKTYALAYTYIKLLLGEKDSMTGRYTLVKSAAGRHRAILAITFTNKATEEMKTRIIARLTELSMRQHCEYEDDLCRDLSCSLGMLQDRARQALNSLLDDYTQFNVTTIDSFFQMVLRVFARELNVSSAYEIDLDTEHAITVGVRETLSSINRTSERSPRWKRVRLLTKWLGDYMDEQLSGGNSINVFRPSQGSDRMVKFIKSNLDETYRLNLDEIRQYTDDIERIQRFSQALSRKQRDITTTLASLIDNLSSQVARYGFNTSNFATNMYKNLLRWQAGNYEIKDTARVYDDPVEKRYKKPKKKVDAFDIPPEVDAALCATLRYGVENLGSLKFYRLLRDDLFNLGIFADVERNTAEYLRENQSILLDSTQSMLRRIISRDETPFIYERLGMQLRHFLIDEFQDTSRLQWLNLSPLVEDSVDSGYDNLIIGDEKQSIYRFRNAAPELISTIVPRQFARSAQIKGTQGSENTNYRSAWHIVGFNNAVFAGVAVCKNMTDVYSNVVQKIENVDLPGYVVMKPYDDETESLENLATHIARQLAAGYSQRDIAILVDTRQQGNQVVNFLLERAANNPTLAGLQIVTQEALRIDTSPAVRRVISILRYTDSIRSVNNTSKGRMTVRQQLAAVINRFEHLRGQGMSHGDALSEAFSDKAITLDAESMEVVEGEYVTLPTIVEHIIERFTDVTERSVENIYLSAFQDCVTTFVAHGSRGLHQFIKWWDESGSRRSVDVPQGIDAINVMTVHKSKGLEFACVHIPLFNWPRKLNSHVEYSWFRLKNEGKVAPEFDDAEIFNPDDVPPMMPLRHSGYVDYMSLTPQYEQQLRDADIDTLNKTYVAFTRAARELIVGYTPKSKSAIEVVDAIKTSDCGYSLMASAVANFSEDTAPGLSDFMSSDGTFEFGSPTIPVGGKTPAPIETMPPYVSYRNEEIWRLNRLEDIDDMLSARHEGIVLHDIMAGVRHVADVPRAVRHSMMRGYLPVDRCDEVIGLLTRAVSDKTVVKWFEGYKKVLIERPIANVEQTEHFKKSKRKTPHNRPDRIVWLPDGSIEIIDYKFGDDRSSYTSQMRDYMRYVSDCFPDAIAVRGYLWHPLTGEMRLVTLRRGGR